MLKGKIYQQKRFYLEQNMTLERYISDNRLF